MLALAAALPVLGDTPGARLPWRSYEAEAMQTDGVVLGPSRDPYNVATESSGLRCVRLEKAGEQVQFAVMAAANSLVVRYSLPDAPGGGGTTSTLALFVNGRRERTLALDSRCAWLYGQYPFSNRPSEGKPRNFYNEVRVPNVPLVAGDVVRLQWERKDVDYCILDLVDLEPVEAPLSPPTGAFSVRDFGARGNGVHDDTAALRTAIAAAASRPGVVWVPPGEYLITGDVAVPSHVTIQGAGMWHTTFVGDARLYGNAARRVRFRLKGERIVLSDFAVLGRLDYRNDNEPNDGIVTAGCADSEIRRIWIEHTKVGIWVYNGANLRIEGCRIRDTLADGVNLCVGTDCTLVENCSTRGTGDDCFAIWPAASDQGFVGQRPHPGGNVFRHCTGQLPFLANGGAIYGGESNRIEDCAFTDITAGCGVLLSTTFPTDDPAHGIDNNFSGKTVVDRCVLLRCGGYDHDWAYRGSVQICLDRHSIGSSGGSLRLSHLKIVDSLSDGITVVAPGSQHGQGTLSNAVLADSTVERTPDAVAKEQRGLWIRADAEGGLDLKNDVIPDIRNEAPHFLLGN
jgi:hypothetical protein